MNQKFAASVLIILSLIFASTILSINDVVAQSSNYTIQSVDHVVEVMFSGHIVIRDEIKISGTTTNGFQIGIPSKYATSVLKVVAFDNNREYLVEIVNQLGGQSGFYGAKVNFEGQNPQAFTIEFVLSNNLISETIDGYYIDYPAYPAFTSITDRCKVTLSLPIDPETITIFKNDGQINSTTYYYQGALPAYSNIPASAVLDLPIGLLHLVDISTLNREITIAPSGDVSCIETYNIKNLDAVNLGAFMLNLPSNAKNVIVRDSSGTKLPIKTVEAGSILIVNTSLSSYIIRGQAVQVTTEYTLPRLTGNSNNFTLFPAINYCINSATCTLTLPSDAVVTIDDSSTTITSNWREQKLTINRQDVTYVDYQIPRYNIIQINYNFNPLWALIKPAIMVIIVAIICFSSILIWKKQKAKNNKAPKEKNKHIKNNENKKTKNKKHYLS